MVAAIMALAIAVALTVWAFVALAVLDARRGRRRTTTKES